MAAKGTSFAEDTSDREIVVERVFDAPRELVWKAWTDPQHLPNWWGPNGFTTTIEKMDVRPGGEWNQVMHGPDGTDYPGKIVYAEVLKPERLRYSLRGGKAGAPEVQFQAVVTFAEQGGKTKLTLRMVFASAAARDLNEKTYHAIEGGNQTLARLAEYLPKMPASNFDSREVVITRVFDAPRELVWKAWTDPKHLARWWGPKGFTNPVCEADVRVGGAWHIVMRMFDGNEFPCGGVYKEVVKPERLVFTNDALDKEGNPIIEGLTTVTFAEEGGKTKLTLRTRGTAAVEYANAYLKGMEIGWTQSLERLAEELARG